MKKRLIGKPACIAILAVLIIISLVEIILRGVLLKEAMFGLANAGEPIITALFSLMLIIFATKEKERLFYICTGGFLFYFVLNQLFGLPAMIGNFVNMFNLAGGIHPATLMTLLHALSIISITAIGGLLVEYMNDGSIYNKAFNTLCIITVVMLLAHSVIGCIDVIVAQRIEVILAILNNFSRITMIFLFATFAYDTAKKQLAKTKLTK